MITRRTMTFGLTSLTALATGAGRSSAAMGWTSALPAQLRTIEARSGGRLGVAVIDTENDEAANYRGAELFPMCSTSKLLIVGAILQKVDAGTETLVRRIPVAEADLLSYAPETRKHVGGEMTIADLCGAALTWSDNTAANLLLGQIGGPSGVTALARKLGDDTTRLDRTEPGLNEALPGDPRDTTMPSAMAANLKRLTLGDALSQASRGQLVEWLVGCKTGDRRLRAGFAKDWRVGDKTGTGERGTANDIAVIWPGGRKPVLVTAYLTGAPGDDAAHDAVLAAVGHAIATAYSG